MEVHRGAVRLLDVTRRFRIDRDQVIAALDGVPGVWLRRTPPVPLLSDE
jgi:hypothetical protein